jgi:hypothetical protein
MYLCKGINEPIGAKGPPLVGEEVFVGKEDVGKVGS